MKYEWKIIKREDDYRWCSPKNIHHQVFENKDYGNPTITWYGEWQNVGDDEVRLQMFDAGVSVASRLPTDSAMELTGHSETLYCWNAELFFAGFACVELDITSQINHVNSRNEQGLERQRKLLLSAQAHLIEADKFRGNRDMTWVSHSDLSKEVVRYLQLITKQSLALQSEKEAKAKAKDEAEQQRIKLMVEEQVKRELDARKQLEENARREAEAKARREAEEVKRKDIERISTLLNEANVKSSSAENGQLTFDVRINQLEEAKAKLNQAKSIADNLVGDNGRKAADVQTKLDQAATRVTQLKMEQRDNEDRVKIDALIGEANTKLALAENERLSFEVRISYLEDVRIKFIQAKSVADNLVGDNGRKATEIQTKLDQATTRITRLHAEKKDKEDRDKIDTLVGEAATKTNQANNEQLDFQTRFAHFEEAKAKFNQAKLVAESLVGDTDGIAGRIQVDINRLVSELNALRLDEQKLEMFRTANGNNVVLYKGRMLGSGSTGVVYRASWSGVPVGDVDFNPQNAIVIKKFKTPGLSDGATRFQEESDKLIRFKSDYLVKHYDYVNGSPHYSIVMEYMPDGCLYDMLHNGRELPWNLRWSIAMDISKGVEALHDADFIHRDIKSLNVLLCNGRAKLADFGYAEVKLTSRSVTTQSGRLRNTTLAWTAPEMFDIDNPAECSLKTDMYSYGMTLWELGSRKVPFATAANADVLRHWVAMKKKEDLSEIEIQQPGLAKLIRPCWTEPSVRRDIKTAIAELETEMPRYESEGQRIPLLFSS